MALKIYGYEMSIEDFLFELLERRIHFDINSMHQEDEFLKLISLYEASLYPEETEAQVPSRLEVADEEANKIIASINQIKFPKRSGKDTYEGWKRIPSMDSMELILADYNIELAKIGFKKRLPNTITFIGTENNAMNMYMAFQIRRLKRLRESDKTKYWKVVVELLKYSVSFRTSAFNRVLPNWGHALSLEKVAGIAKEVERIISTFDENLVYKRVYLKEPNKIRPLGVPTAEGRVVMHMVNNFLTLFLRPKIEGGNHGFLPGRGTMSAVKELVDIGSKAKYIYEFDFKQFFPSVNYDRISILLRDSCMPGEFACWLGDINACQPELPEELLLDSDKLLYAANESETLETSEFYRLSLESSEEMNSWEYDFYAADAALEDSEDCIGEDESLKPEEVKVTKGPIRYLQEDREVLGLPQGLNTSPILAIYSISDGIEKLKEKGIKALMYADDGILYSEKKFELPEPPEGHEFHESKSRGVRKGKKTEVFKFLGLDIDLKKGEISGNTRKGNKLKFNAKAENLVDLIRELSLETSMESMADSRLKNITSSGLGGFIQNKLYNGSWEGEIAQESKKGKQHKGSWGVKTYNKKFWNVKEGNRLKHRGLSSKAVNVLIEIIKDSRVG